MFGHKKSRDEADDNGEELQPSRFNTANFEPTGAVGEPTPKTAEPVSATVRDLLSEVQKNTEIADLEESEDLVVSLDNEDSENVDGGQRDSSSSEANPGALEHEDAPSSQEGKQDARRASLEMTYDDDGRVDPWLSDLLESEEVLKKKREEFKQYQGHFARLNDFPVPSEHFTRTQGREKPELKMETRLASAPQPVVYDDEESVILRPRELLAANMYDDLINWNTRLNREAPLFHRAFSAGKIARIVDVGCGCGRHAILFASWGKKVIGIDGGQGALKVARTLAEESAESIAQAGGSVGFEQGEIGAVNQVVGTGCVEAIVCVDDTLPRVGSLAGLRAALDDFADALLPSGILVLGFANHTHFQQRHIRTTAPVVYDTAEGRKIFFRVLDYPASSNIVNVDTLSLSYNAKGCWHVRSQKETDLFISPESIERELLGAGFDLLEVSGDYGGRPLDRLEDETMIVIARRKRHRPSR